MTDKSFYVEVLPIWQAKDREIFEPDDALAVLLADGHVFHQIDGYGVAHWFANCNDVFMWGCADCEPFDLRDVEELYRASRSKWGTTKWACHKRKYPPQAAIITAMKKEGAWDDDMEALRENIDK